MNKNIINNLISAIETRNSEAVGQLLAEDIIFENIPEGNTIYGRQAVQEKFANFFKKASSIRWDIERKIFNDGTVIIEKKNNICLEGKNIILAMVAIIEVRDDKISVFKEYFDSQSLIKQLEN